MPKQPNASKGQLAKVESRMAKSETSTPHGRRDFFKQAASKLAQRVASYVDDGIANHLPDNPELTSIQPPVKRILRPPGALPEDMFLDTCQRCGHCIDSCPAEAIRPYKIDIAALSGTPYITPESQPCVVCDSLACMEVCPSGALQKLSSNQIEIGLAEVDHNTCLRANGIQCTYCVDSCPIGETAIGISSQNQIEILFPGCVGCGVCEYECPTVPKAVVIT